jgi:hypothetical protein
MGNLANTLGDQGKLEEAVELVQKAAQGMTQNLGEEHPNTRVANANLVRLAEMRASERPPTTTPAQAKRRVCLWLKRIMK